MKANHTEKFEFLPLVLIFSGSGKEGPEFAAIFGIFASAFLAFRIYPLRLPAPLT